MKRKNGGKFVGNSFYKVRQKSTGLYYMTAYRASRWEEAGKVYQNLNGARTCARSIHGPKDDIEIVEFQAAEIDTHPVKP